MSVFLPTTKVTILAEKVGEDEYGDPTDEHKAVKTGVSAHIWEKQKSSFTPVQSEGWTDTVITVSGILPTNVDVSKGARIKDEKSGRIYQVMHVYNDHNPVMLAPTRVELQIVN